MTNQTPAQIERIKNQMVTIQCEIANDQQTIFEAKHRVKDRAGILAHLVKELQDLQADEQEGQL